MVDSENGKPLPNGVNADHKNCYGLGISAEYEPLYNTTIYSHGGGTLGFISRWGFVSQNQTSYAFAFNATFPKFDIVSEDYLKRLHEFIKKSCF